ncbi:MAG TPA: polysaccharide deacetylase family protein [Candidatus Saccharimonadales bacterium]|nr:polysaccharide deacetylase family protein [Candidatus Saccharimonadales bacterium]
MKQIIITERTKKHISLVAGLWATSAIVLLGIFVFILLNPDKYKTDVPTSRISTPRPSLVINHYDVHYPILKNEKIDNTLKGYATAQEDAFAKKIKGKESDARNKLTLTYKIVHHGQETATVVFYQREEITGEPVLTSQNMMTFGFLAEKQLVVTDLFRADVDVRSTIADLLYDYLKQYDPTSLSPAEFANLLNLQMSNIQGFWLDGDNVILSLNLHQLGSAVDTKTVAMKKELLAGILNPEFIALDPDAYPVAATPVPSYAIIAMPKRFDQIDPNGKMLALTFDDGPGGYTNRVLDVLKQYRSHATFFVIGRQVSGYAGVELRTIAEGNEIGNHSWSHPDLTTLSYAGMQQQVGDTQRAIQAATGGFTPTLMRPPYGAINGVVNSFLRNYGLTETLWNVDTQDWLDQNAQIVYDRIMGSAADNRIILLHDIHPTSVAAVERAIPALVRDGYQLVTVSQLLHYR